MTDCLIGLQCCDCGHPCPIVLTLLTADGRIVELAACPKCRDGRTLKCYKGISPAAYRDAMRRGLPVLH